MPSCRVTNLTDKPLNICLKQVTALHFENGVEPGQTIKLKPGKVWFTLEAIIDDETKKSRYSVLKSAATIALLSVAVAAAAATAGAALLPSSAAAGTAATAGAAGSYISKGATVTKAALVKNSGTIAKLSSVALPKAIDRLSAEVGGLSALQREVLSIIASPTFSKDVRHQASAMLRGLGKAYKDDKAKTKEARASGAAESGPSSSSRFSASVPGSSASLDGTSTSGGGASLTPLSDADARELEQAIESGRADEQVENAPVKTGEVLRVHGIYMSERREFTIRTDKEGRLELWDSKTGERW